MICNSCKNEFDNLSGLKFCPFCGTKIEEPVVLTEIIQEKQEDEEKKDKFDTLKMPVINKEQIKKYKKEKFFNAIKKPFKDLKLVITITTVVLLMIMGGVGYVYFSNRPVEEGRIKDDIINKTVLLPKGTSLEIKKGYIKSFSISERNTNKNEKKDDIKVAVTINNNVIEVKTLLSLQYIYNENKKWVISDKISLTGDTSVKPLVGMDEKQILEEVKKMNIMLGNTSKPLNSEEVKTLTIASRTPDFNNLKEEVLVDVSLDTGIIAASGKMKCKLNFENEVWTAGSIERNSAEDFALILSPSFSQDKILDVIKKDALNLTVTHPDVFNGVGFYAANNFNKEISIADKKFDAQNGKLTVTVKRQNVAGELKTTLSTDYTLALSLSKVELLNKSKTTVDGVAVNDISRDFIVANIVNAEIEGDNIFLWYSSNHKITAEEAKTFKTNKVLSKKGLNNVKYVYGSITYKDGSKQKTSNVVAVYFLVYDSTKGYYWKLNKIIGEDSPSYKNYIPEPK